MWRQGISVVSRSIDVSGFKHLRNVAYNGTKYFVSNGTEIYRSNTPMIKAKQHETFKSLRFWNHNLYVLTANEIHDNVMFTVRQYSIDGKFISHEVVQDTKNPLSLIASPSDLLLLTQ